ncbi:MAG: OmpA family protein [Bdellovibrionales bacterium]|nr:OmpA family protein [Bdellovibrionales bacterium]
MRTKKKNIEVENHERWLVSYADFITLLFAFFVVLFATSEQNTEKSKKFEESVNKYLIKLSAGSLNKKSINNEELKNTPIDSPLKKHNKTNSQLNNLQVNVENYIEKNFAEREIDRIIQDISEEDIGLRVTFRASSLFERNSKSFKKSAIKYLVKLGELFKKINYRVYIESHSNETTDAWELTAGRGTNLVEYFINQHDISPARIAAISYGNSRPILSSNKYAKGSTNNRVDFLILTEDIGL